MRNAEDDMPVFVKLQNEEETEEVVEVVTHNGRDPEARAVYLVGGVEKEEEIIRITREKATS